jgi:hypothetical protein
MTEIIIVSGLNIVCFLIGAIVGQRVFERKPVIINPVKEIKEYKEEQEISKEEQRFKDIADNIDAYNGTAIGQKKIGG